MTFGDGLKKVRLVLMLEKCVHPIRHFCRRINQLFNCGKILLDFLLKHRRKYLHIFQFRLKYLYSVQISTYISLSMSCLTLSELIKYI